MSIHHTSSPPLSLDCLARIQTTLLRRSRERDPSNILTVGLAPALENSATAMPPVIARYHVQRKRQRMAPSRRIPTTERVRLLDRNLGRYSEISLQTEVVEQPPVVCTGVRISAESRISSESRSAISCLVVRWLRDSPEPQGGSPEFNWRWGVVTVSHLFRGLVRFEATESVRIERQAACEPGPREIAGRLIAQGRTTADPDIALVETSLERLWLSGFLTDTSPLPIETATEQQLAHWASSGATGTLFGRGSHHSWRWTTYYPLLRIEGLGYLRHIIRFEVEVVDEQRDPRPLAPGTSGSLLVAGGIPVAIQIAAERPDFRVGYAQALLPSLAWLSSELAAGPLQVVAAG